MAGFFAAVITSFILALVGAGVLLGVAISAEPERAPLANRIQTVCKKGFHVKDWLPESAYWGLETTPEEVVYVICESDSAAQFGLRETYGVVVKR